MRQIGIEIFQDRSCGLLGLPQKAYIEGVLGRFDMEKCYARVAPIQKGANSPYAMPTK